MSESFRREQVQLAGPRMMAYVEWGDPGGKALVCVHGLTRCARDFDYFAPEMARHGYRVICPDVVGRGDSSWLADPMDYAVPTYTKHMLMLLVRLELESVRWVGTSLGGLIGMSIAAMPGSPIDRLVLNDVGPVLGMAAVQRIATYVGKWPPLPTIEAAEQFVRFTSASFGPHTDAEWRFLTEHVVRRNADGSLRMHYDPAIAVPFNAEMPTQDVELWSLYDAIRCPTLVLRGEQSDLLARETVAQMAVRGPRATVVEIQGVGHAPTLVHADQIAIVRDYLLAAA
ncbi:MAG TPA: alpha/beta hydrolase [Burkholderiales bacterium]|nr:alpha/beta hydrolase [Burkholderiales bacterium]